MCNICKLHEQLHMIIVFFKHDIGYGLFRTHAHILRYNDVMFKTISRVIEHKIYITIVRSFRKTLNNAYFRNH